MNRYGKWPFILSLASVLAMVCYCLSAWLLYERYCRLFDAGYTSFYVPLCGKSMQYFIWWGAGLAGWLFISSADSGSRAHRACIWGMLQFISAWVLVYPAAVLGHMNDGSGMLFILFAPLATLPSFAAALLAGMMQKSGQSPRSCLRAQLEFHPGTSIRCSGGSTMRSPPFSTVVSASMWGIGRESRKSFGKQPPIILPQ